MEIKEKRFRVMIVEDDPMAARHLAFLLNDMEEFCLAHTIENAMLAEVYCYREKIDLILMDVCTAMHSSGLKAAVKIKKNIPSVKIIILTSQLDSELVRRARDGKVEGFGYKLLEDAQIEALIRRVMAGEEVYPPTPPAVAIGNVSSTEIDWQHMNVLRELSAGETDEEIAEKLHLSVYTVKKYISHLKDMTGYRNRTELAVAASRLGLVTPGYW